MQKEPVDRYVAWKKIRGAKTERMPKMEGYGFLNYMPELGERMTVSGMQPLGKEYQDGFTTSKVIAMELIENGFLVTTENSLYQLNFTQHNFAPDLRMIHE